MATRRCSYTAAFKLKLVLLCNRPSVRDPPRAACRSVANVRVNRVTIQIRIIMTGLKYGCVLYSVRLPSL